MKELKTRHTNTSLWQGRELDAMHVLLKTKTQEQTSSVQNATLGCRPAPVSRYISPTCISKDQYIWDIPTKSARFNCVIKHTIYS
jgi:hypothetical protein